MDVVSKKANRNSCSNWFRELVMYLPPLCFCKDKKPVETEWLSSYIVDFILQSFKVENLTVSERGNAEVIMAIFSIILLSCLS